MIDVVSSLMRDTITIKRETVSAVDGFATTEWTTVARGSGGITEPRCRIQDMPSAEAAAYGVSADIRSWKIYFAESPMIDARDHVFLTDSDGTEHECRVLKPSWSFDGPMAAVWRCDVAEYIATQEE
jgi:hypothetical protein